MKILRYEDSLKFITEEEAPVIFFAGPTVRGHQPHLTSWRPDAIAEFEKQGFDGVLILPEFTSKTESDKGKEWIPKWEFTGLAGSDAIMFWVPRTKELIGLTTNHEHGYWLAKLKNKLTYGHPDDAYRMSYLDIMIEIDFLQNHDFARMPIWNNLPDLVTQTIEVANESYETVKKYGHAALGSNRIKAQFPVESPYGAF